MEVAGVAFWPLCATKLKALVSTLSTPFLQQHKSAIKPSHLPSPIITPGHPSLALTELLNLPQSQNTSHLASTSSKPRVTDHPSSAGFSLIDYITHAPRHRLRRINPASPTLSPDPLPSATIFAGKLGHKHLATVENSRFGRQTPRYAVPSPHQENWHGIRRRNGQWHLAEICVGPKFT
jgi:hypothetical protein